MVKLERNILQRKLEGLESVNPEDLEDFLISKANNLDRAVVVVMLERFFGLTQSDENLSRGAVRFQQRQSSFSNYVVHSSKAQPPTPSSGRDARATSQAS